jgi:hypothetical protein
VIAAKRGCNTPLSRMVPSSLEPCALALLHEGPWYGLGPAGYKLMVRRTNRQRGGGESPLR